MDNKITILIVDDDLIGHEVLRALLDDQGHNLAFASNGREALAKAAKLVPDLILLDVMMPDMNGFEVCLNLRSDSVLAEVPIIMITAMNDRDSRLKSIEVGADDFISKPFDRLELQMRIRNIARLNRYRHSREADSQLEDKLARLSALYDISSMLNSTIDVDLLLKSIIQKIKTVMNVANVSILLDDRRKEGLCPSISEAAEVSPIMKPCFLNSPDITGCAYKNGKPVLNHSANPDGICFKEIANKHGYETASLLCVPLRGKGGILGILKVINKETGKFTVDDQRLLESMADNIAVSIEKAKLYWDLQEAGSALRHQNAELKQMIDKKHQLDNIIGNSENMLEVLKRAEQVAYTDATVLVFGETGTGKDLLAQAIHQSSPRAQGGFIAINCAAIPENLLESELFGHEKGSFTGATARRVGRFEEANGGTLFLDEIGDMPLALQVKLLRVLQEGNIQRLGSNQETQVDVRVIAATHQNLGKLVEEGEFRQDLYYRLKVFELNLPPLRERKSDIPLLISHFMERYNKVQGKHIKSIEENALDILLKYDYPGNVRELRNVIESTMILCKGNAIEIDDLPKEIRISSRLDADIIPSVADISIPRNNDELKAAKTEAQRQIERIFLIELLSSNEGNVSKAAREARINRTWLCELINRHQLEKNIAWN